MKDYKWSLQECLNILHKVVCKYLHEIICKGLSKINKAAECRKNRIGGRVRMDKLALGLMIAGAVNWGLVGIFSFDAVAWLLGGQTSIFSRIVYILIAIAGCWGLSMFFRGRTPAKDM